MKEIIISDSISEKEIVLTKENISDGYSTIEFKDVINFKFEHSYHTLNGITRGGIDFRIYSKDSTIKYIVKAGTFYSKKESEENLRKVSNLFDHINEDLMVAFIKNAIHTIDKNESYKVCKMQFRKDGIYMRQRVYYWLNEIHVPYCDAEIEGDQARWGLLYSGGTSNLLRLINTKTEESYKYSRKIDFQPNSIEIFKAQKLLQHIISNELFNSTEETNDYSKRL